ncbi:MAG: aspartate kinase [Bacteroidales bacterium]
MIVYKFGGASVRDTNGIKNLRNIILAEENNLVIVVSAFGKTTNALEEVLKLWHNGGDYSGKLNEIYAYHVEVAGSLPGSHDNTVDLFTSSFFRLKDWLRINRPGRFDHDYDQIVSYGEIWSTIIVAGYLNNNGVEVVWKDARECIVTDDRFRDANVYWEESGARVKKEFNFNNESRYLTQGFIGGTVAGETTTLGREGSDYTAAIIGNLLDAEKVVVWKDVPGILNADPKWLEGAELLGEISYKEAVEMTFSGAKVIHPKTIKPLHNKNIPLHVRSFINPEGNGTVIRAEAERDIPVPVYIRKETQILISILPKDFSFVMGDNLGKVFHAFTTHGVKVNLVQASAVSINVCADDERERIVSLINDLGDDFKAIYNDNVEMLSIRHYTPASIEKITLGREVLLEQKTRRIVRFVVRSDEGKTGK